MVVICRDQRIVENDLTSLNNMDVYLDVHLDVSVVTRIG